MAEDMAGNWVTYTDHTQSVLDANKLVEKSWRARDTLSLVNETKVDHLRDVIVGMSVGLFISFACLIFIGLA